MCPLRARGPQVALALAACAAARPASAAQLRQRATAEAGNAVALRRFGPPARAGPSASEGHGLVDLYLSTLRDTLTGTSLKTPKAWPINETALGHAPFQDEERERGDIWCEYCYTMAGNARLSSVRQLLEQAFEEGVPGDFVETGVWRGGTSIFARAVQRSHGEGEARRVYACDSFNGVPKASTPWEGNWFNSMHFLEVPMEEVRDHFNRFQMLDQNVVFVQGYFQQSLPKLRRELLRENRSIAVLRGDGDLSESYHDILYNLYDLVPVGGYFICDDCPNILMAQLAVEQFRRRHNITDPLIRVAGSHSGSFWRKSSPVAVDYGHYLAWNSTRKAA